jgi:hypothetical protein
MHEPAALQIDLAPSRLAAAAIVVGIIATAALVAWLPGQPWWRAVGVIALGAHAIALVRIWAIRTAPHSIVSLVLGPGRHIVLTERRGRRIVGVVQADSYVGGVLTTIVMRPAGRSWSRSMAILPDMLSAEDFRRLRVRLRLAQAPDPIDSVGAKEALDKPVRGEPVEP